MAAAKIKHGTATGSASSETLDGVYQRVEVFNRDATNTIYFTVDGTTPTVGGDNCWVVIPQTWVQINTPSQATTVVKLIASGSAAYSVAGLTAFELLRGS